MEKTDWTLVLAAIAAVGSLINVWTGWARSRREERAASELAGRRWSVRLRKGAAGRHLRATFSYDPGSGPSVQIKEVRSVKPRGLTMCAFREESDGPPDYQRREEVPDGDRRYHILRFGDDLGGRVQPQTTGRAGSRINEAEALVQMPRKPFWRRGATTRLLFAVRYEERTANRATDRVLVSSEEAPWAF